MSLCLSCTKSRNLLQASLSLPQKTIVRNSKVSKRRKETQRVLAPHLTVKYVEKTPRIMALIYFDDHYKKLFGKDWHPIRLALLSHSKPSALLNNFAPIDQVRSELTGLGCMSLQDLYKDYNPEERLSASPTAQASSFPARPERRDEDEDTPNPALSMDAELAKKRLISPSEQVLGNAEALALYDFVPTKNIKGMEDFVEEIDYYESYQKLDDIPILIQRPSIDVPKHLDAFYFGSHNLSRFPSPRQTVLNTLNYYCMDLASLLPVLALNLQPEVWASCQHCPLPDQTCHCFFLNKKFVDRRI